MDITVQHMTIHRIFGGLNHYTKCLRNCIKLPDKTAPKRRLKDVFVGIPTTLFGEHACDRHVSLLQPIHVRQFGRNDPKDGSAHKHEAEGQREGRALS